MRPLPCANSAVRTTRRNECGFEVAGGTCTYLLRPAQKITVATAISRPGMPNATLGPYSRRKMGIRSEAKDETKLMIQSKASEPTLARRSEEDTSERQSPMRSACAV